MRTKLRSELNFNFLSVSLFLLVFLFVLADVSFGQSGRIDGTVTDQNTGEELIGVNIYIQELETGAATNIEGYYSILNVSPGTYTLRVSSVGYATAAVSEVRVNINQTTTVDVELREEAFSGEEITVTAVRPVVERDVSASQVNLNAAQIERLPVSSITGAIGLQAGIQGLNIRSGRDASGQTLSFMVDGLTLRDERDNTPYTSVSLTSVSEVQVQTGGFNAEFGNVRSGIINVVTKEGDRDRYNVDAIVRYSPPGPKNFGPPINDPNSYFLRPYLDDEVAWTGTGNGAWDRYTQRSYPEFEGWIAISEQTLSDGNPDTDLTPEAAQQLFLWQHRKEFEITEPDYNIDMTLSGPVPGISGQLGDLRFMASHRRVQNMYLIPLSRDRFLDQSSQFKLTSDVSRGRGMKLTLEGLYGQSSGTNSNNLGQPGIFSSPAGIAANVSSASFLDSRIYSTDYWAPTNVTRLLLGGKFTHALSSNTYYEVKASHFSSQYDTNPGPLRDTTGIRQFGNSYMADEAPFGFWPAPSSGIGSGMRMGVGMSNSRDSSYVGYLTLQADITSQLNRYNQVKTGIEFVRTDSRVNYRAVDEFLPSGRTSSVWNEVPLRGAVFAQNKLEFEGMVANIGLRLDYSHSNTDWFEFDPYDEAFTANLAPGMDTLLTRVPTDHQITLSPRIGVSFPITVSSKLYFNYGHFRSMPTPENLYMIRQSTEDQAVARMANPNNPLPQTVAYELGYEHSLFDTYLIRAAGYYRDISKQPSLVRFRGSGSVAANYQISQPFSYEDTRGLELTFSKQSGRFFQGFVNYTYMVYSFGRFGYAASFENPVDQRNFEREEGIAGQTNPVARPYGRINLDFFSPREFGPQFGEMRPLADWRLSVVGSWQAGRRFTWSGGGGSIPGLENNVQWRDSYNVNLRLSKDFRFADSRMQVFMDMNNVLNTKSMAQFANYGFVDGEDYNRYMRSLHLPGEILDEIGSYSSVPGNDRPGDYRKSGVDFVPIESVSDIQNVNNPQTRALYYESTTQQYFQFTDGEWTAADNSKVNQVLSDKAYIEMPNMEPLTFLNPRNIYWGVRITF